MKTGPQQHIVRTLYRGGGPGGLWEVEPIHLGRARVFAEDW